jgi:hypothetical protein
VKCLGSGDSQVSLCFSYILIPSTENAEEEEEIINAKGTAKIWIKIADDFYSMRQFPNCLGIFDEHFEMPTSENSASLYFNYKRIFSSLCRLGTRRYELQACGC